MLENTGNQKPKSFWQKPEGITGAIIGIGIILAAGYLLYTILPFLISLFQNILYAGLLLIAIGVLVYIILDPKFRNLIWYLYKVVMRKITAFFIQIDPIAIIKTYIDELKNKRGKMDAQITKLNGEIGKLKKILSDNTEQTDDNLRMAKKAKEMNKNAEFIMYSREAGRLDESNKKLLPLQQRMEKMNGFLQKMYDSAGYFIRDMESEIRVKEQEYNAIKSSHSAIKSAMNIINGNTDERMMFDQAMEYIQDDMGKKLGEMERFMQLSSHFINGVDIQNGVYEEKGLEMLEEMQEKDFNFMLPSGTKSETKPDDNYKQLFR